MNEKALYNEWIIKADDDCVLQELKKIDGDEHEIKARFYQGLSFGTGGLRGEIGAGVNRMNTYTVRRATLGLSRYLLSKNRENLSVVIAYDSRNKSFEFAKSASETLSSEGIKTYLFSEITPTPVLSFAVRYLHADAGIVITASHNPKEYNGYKVYNEKGCQITDEMAKGITAEIEKYGYFEKIVPNPALIVNLFGEVKEEFLRAIEKYAYDDYDQDLSVVYTPLNGAGKKFVEDILRRRGLKKLHIVSEQSDPNPDFTTCPYPNPEEKEALSLAIKDAKKINADLILATDPDSDRVGVAVKSDGEYQRLNGNETGALLLNYLLEQKSAFGTLGKAPSVIKTIVTTDMALPIVKKYGGTLYDTLTGFKYIGEKMDEIPDFLFGFEESYGYLVGDHARDKDAVSACSLIVEMASHYSRRGQSLVEVLRSLQKEHGYFVSHLTGFAFKGVDGMNKMNSLLTTIRSNPWAQLLDEKAELIDYSIGVDGLPKSNVLQFRSKSYKVTVRPSGTEPKLKAYFEVRGESELSAQEKMQALEVETLARIEYE